jgi:hypothetical protein
MAADMDATNRSIGESAGISHGDQMINEQVTTEMIHGKEARLNRSGNAAKATKYGARNPASVSMWRVLSSGFAAY